MRRVPWPWRPAWDTRGRLLTVTDYDQAGGPATQVVDYIYATDNRWLGEDVDLDADGQIDHQRRFVYDEGQGRLKGSGVFVLDKIGDLR